jgi:AcrR family transcriptional regulator
MHNKSGAYHHGNLRRALIDAALVLITAKGVEAFTIREVARQAGVSHTAPYRHFSDKAELLEAVAVEGFDLMEKKMHRRIASYPDDALLRFKACGLAYIDFTIEHASHYRVMFRPGRSDEGGTEVLKKAGAACFGTLLGCITDCQGETLIREGDPHPMALAAWSIVHGFGMLLIDNHVRETGVFHSVAATMRDVVTDTLYYGLIPVTTGDPQPIKSAGDQV